jgi:anhydro-N-acetylmuramic acid kinase
LALAQGEAPIALDELGALDGWVAETFAAAAIELLHQAQIPASAVLAMGSHGQTLRHRPAHTPPYTLQLGDPNIIAERTGIQTVADFRRRDMAAGGQGAPLVPAFHAAVLRSAETTRVILNLGGIANVTILPIDAVHPVIGFDTGPGNCLLDAWVERHLGQSCDRNGAFARSGQVDSALLQQLRQDPYFAKPAPKSTGRETFHLTWLDNVLGTTPRSAANVQATLVELTAISIADAIRDYAGPPCEVLACGGGVHNPVLMEALARTLAPAKVASTARCGIDPDYVEAMAFAWLARQRLNAQPGNVPAVTGASHACVLGGIYPGR